MGTCVYVYTDVGDLCAAQCLYIVTLCVHNYDHACAGSSMTSWLLQVGKEN